jgi:3-hydroxyisobutyrate dehydrogenase/glyoxylate/succinic semialdehyde reductase
MKVGFIGLGIMGSRMAANLLNNGYELSLYNRTPDKAEALLAQGATWCDSPEEVAKNVDVLITMLSTPEVLTSMAVATPESFVHSLKPGSIWVDCTTVDPKTSRMMAEVASARQIHFLDAPVAGSKIPAERGELLFLVGGEAEIVGRCAPLFEVMGRKTIHVGGNGMGTSLKMVINLLLGQAMAAFSEGMALGESLGIERDTLLDILLGSAVVPPFVAAKRDKITQNQFDPEFPLRWMHKDLHLAAETAFAQGVSMPLANAAKETYALAKQKGLGDNDFSAIYQFLHKREDVE